MTTAFAIQDIPSDIIMQYVAPYFRFTDIKHVYLSGLMMNMDISPDDVAKSIIDNDDKLSKCFACAHISIRDALNHSSISYQDIDSTIYYAKHYHWRLRNIVRNDIVFDMSDLNESKIRNTISVLKALSMCCIKFNQYKLCDFIPTNMVRYMSDAFSIMNKGVICLKRSQNAFLDTLKIVQFNGAQENTYGTRWDMISCDIYGVFERYQYITNTKKQDSNTLKSLIEDTLAVSGTTRQSYVSEYSTLCFFLNLIDNTEVKRSFKIEQRTRFYIAYELFRYFNDVNDNPSTHEPPRILLAYKEMRYDTMEKVYDIRNKIRILQSGILPDYLNDILSKEIDRAIDWRRENTINA